MKQQKTVDVFNMMFNIEGLKTWRKSERKRRGKELKRPQEKITQYALRRKIASR